ncbi:hypothetical protein [Thalassospira marina]|uniref:5-bromo-4-chloroindolyl phosphate hydrolysis protein n=1 Tax=Thalassospira marina TaxID=2048283 RepID=A0A2N3KV22_9PROT|nr:hypothetical protein [Thalassospira marina]PKR54429.1 hypothetical protein COO20_09880 [Thalassospira marina]
MEKLRDWLSPTVIFGVAVIGFLCGTIYGKQFCGIQWETILAGFLGICGGYMAILAARWQDKVQRQRYIDACIDDVTHLKILTSAIRVMQQRLIKELNSALEVFQAPEEPAPDKKHLALLVHAHGRSQIKTIIDSCSSVQSATQQITGDFKTLITLMNRNGLSRFMMDLPLKKLQKRYAKLDNIPSHDPAITFDVERNIISKQLMQMRAVLQDRGLTNTFHAMTLMDRIIDHLKRERERLT